MSSLFLLSNSQSFRPYYVPRELCEGGNQGVLDVTQVDEYTAYLRGEPVTKWIVQGASWSVMCRQIGEVKELGQMKLICDDGEIDSLDISALARRFDLVSDLLELDPSVREIKIPFKEDEVMMAINAIHSENSVRYSKRDFECIKFLRPKNVAQFATYHWEPSACDMDLVRYIGRNVDNETRMNNSELAHIVPDWELYPMASWAYRSRQVDLLLVLLKDYPSALAWCLHQLILIEPISMSPLRDLILTSNFANVKPVHCPIGWRWGIDTDNKNCPMKSILMSIPDPKLFRKCAASFGIVTSSLGNQDLIVPRPFVNTLMHLPTDTLLQECKQRLSSLELDQ